MTELPDYLPISMLNQLAYCERRFWLMYVCGEMAINAPVLEGIYQHQRAHEEGVERDGDRAIHRRVYLWSDRLRISGFADLVEDLPAGQEAAPLSSGSEDEEESSGLPWFDDDDLGRDNRAPTTANDDPVGAGSSRPGRAPTTANDDPVGAGSSRPGHDDPVGAGSSRPGHDDPVGAGLSRPTPRVLQPVEYKHGRQGRWLNDQMQLCAQALCLEERTGQRVERGQIFYWGSRRRVEVEFTPQLRAETEAAVARAYALLQENRPESGWMPPPIEHRAKCHECSLEDICLPREVLFLQDAGGRRQEGLQE